MHEIDDVRFGVITISTSRWKRYGYVRGVDFIPMDDESGRFLVDELNARDYMLIPDDILTIVESVLSMLKDVDVLVTTGGTGISPEDLTIEAVKPLVDREIEGFGEIFRWLSYQDVGERAILTRTFAGVIDEKVVFCLPGSLNAVKLGVKIIKSQVKHILIHLREKQQ
ncbi:MAG: molybdenum cofactor biosynthesis protein [Archaeoglobales archaeon]|nr:MAG: molybdenum cofactor biosynthesis protein [Archaeoglobales archaeon]